MSAVRRLSPSDREALNTGRAIPFFLDHRIAELPGYSLTVIARLDTEQFQGMLVSDKDPGEELIQVELPMSAPLLVPDGAALTSGDAAIVHRLWRQWNEGVRDNYLHLMRQIALAESVETLFEVLPVTKTKPASRPRSNNKPSTPKRGRRS